MNKQQLVDAVGERLGDRKAAAAAVEAVFDTVTGALAEGERVAIFGFGVFEKVDRAARSARNPATGGTVEVAATSVPRFRPGQALKDAVRGQAARPDRSSAARRPVAAGEPAASPLPASATGTKAKKSGKKSESEKKSGKKGGKKK